MQLTANEAQYVLATLLRRGKIRASQIRAAIRWRREEIRQLRERLATLESLRGGPPRGRRRGKPATASRRKLSARVRSLRRLQGKYMGYARLLNSTEKARVRAVRQKQGMLQAIRLAASLAKKS